MAWHKPNSSEQHWLELAAESGMLGTQDPSKRIRDILDAPTPQADPEPFNAEERGRMRFAHALGQESALETAKAWLLHLDCFPNDTRSAFRDFISRVQSRDEFVARLSLVSDIYKQSGPRASHDWMKGVNLNLAIGYVRLIDDASALEQIHTWVDDSRWRPGVGRAGGELAERGVTQLEEERFNKAFEVGAREFFRKAVGTFRERPKALATFLEDPTTWARPGASQVAPSVVSITERGRFKLQRSKWTTATQVSPEQLLAVVKSSVVRQHNNAVVKREAAKTRWIVAGDDMTYLRMAWLSEWIEPKLHDHPNTPLFWSHERRSAWTHRRLAMMSTNYWFTPIDHSKFDHHFTRAMINILVDVFCDEAEATARRYGDTEVAEVASLVRASMAAPQVVTFHGRDGRLHAIPYKQGLLSGWRWTALLNTVGNYAINYAVLRHAGLPFPPDMVCQGDDVTVAWATARHGYTFVRAFAQLGFAVNPAKTFFSRDYDEFLRMVYTKRGRFGYPHRCAPSLLYRKPWSTPTADGPEKIQELSKSWAQLVSRLDVGGDLRRPAARGAWLKGQDARFQMVARWIIRDLAGATRVSNEVVLAWLLSSASVGGGGWGSNAEAATRLQSRVLERVFESGGGRQVTPAPGFGGSVVLNAVPEAYQAVRAAWEALGVEQGVSAAKLADTVLPGRVAEARFSRVTVARHHPSLDKSPLTTMPQWREAVPNLGRQLALSRITTNAKAKLMLQKMCYNWESLMVVRNRLGAKLFTQWLSGSIKPTLDLVTTDTLFLDDWADRHILMVLSQRDISYDHIVAMNLYISASAFAQFIPAKYVLTL